MCYTTRNKAKTVAGKWPIVPLKGLTLEVLVPGALQSKPADVKIDAFSSLRDLF